MQRILRRRKQCSVRNYVVVGCIFLLYYQQHSQYIAAIRCTNGLGHDNPPAEVGHQFTKQRVVILSGPHKTGTTSIQNSIKEWTKPNRNLLTEWSWPVPENVVRWESADERNWNWNKGKGFYALAESLRSKKFEIKNRALFQHHSTDELIQLYRTEFLRSWLMGKNIVFGTEALDFVIKDDDGDRIVEDLKRLMPWRINDNITPENKSSSDGLYVQGNDDSIRVVVTYRHPRIEHLISIWRQTKKEVEPFEQWMTTTTNNLGALDSLGLAEIYLNHGLHVDLIDSSGLSEKGIDISNAVACDILGAPCSDDGKHPVGTVSKEVLRLNTKVDFQGKNRLSENQLEQMDKALNMYDCKYLKMIEDKRLSIIYPNALTKNFGHCAGAIRYDRAELKRQLVCIASGGEDCLK